MLFFAIQFVLAEESGGKKKEKNERSPLRSRHVPIDFSILVCVTTPPHPPFSLPWTVHEIVAA